MSTEETIDYAKIFSLQKELEKAKWYYEDLQKGGWRVIHKVEGKSTFWIKTFREEEIPAKVLMQVHLPLSVQQYSEVLKPENWGYRAQWDKAFIDNEVLETFPDSGGYLVYNRAKLKWPLTDRDFVLFTTVPYEVDWFGKKGYFVQSLNASHKSKPANIGSCIRATNGGNFSVVTADENDPEHACTVFSLSHNSYNGWLPTKRGGEGLVSKAAPKTFIAYYEGIVEGYKRFFADKE